MSLDERLERSRREYRVLEPPDRRRVAPSGRARRLPAVAAAVIVLVALAGGLWWASGRDGAVVTTPTPDRSGLVLDKDDPEPPGAVARFDERVVLDPAGPYTDGEQVVLRLAPGFTEDVGGGRMCAVVADGPGGPAEWCDPVEEQYGTGGSTTEVPVVVHRRVFTPTGTRDCEDPAVVCRFVVRDAEGVPRASLPVRFDGAVAPAATLSVSPTEPQGSVEVVPRGLTPDPSWSELGAADPVRAEGIPALYYDVCAFTGSGTPGPFGQDLWQFTDADGAADLPAPNCDLTGMIEDRRLDPAAPDDAFEVAVPTWIHGYQGWSDCRVDHCFLLVRRSVFQGIEPGGATLASDEPVIAALLPDDRLTDDERPTLRVLTPGPHRPGQELVVEVAGLRRPTNIGVCSIDAPWSCGYLQENFGSTVDGQQTLRLPDSVGACRPESCYLELDAQGEGVPPLAVAPLDTPG